MKLNKINKEWGDRVKANFDNKCAVCGSNQMIQAHHIIPKEFKIFKELREDIKNGIALCPKCHRWGSCSAHYNGFAFNIWLLEHYPDTYTYLKARLLDITSTQNIYIL